MRISKIQDPALLARLAEERKREAKLRREQDKRLSTLADDLTCDVVDLLQAYCDLSTNEKSCTLARLTMALFVKSNDTLVSKHVLARDTLKLPIVYSTATEICTLLGITDGAVNAWEDEIPRARIEHCANPGRVLDLIWHNEELTMEVDEMLVDLNKTVPLLDLPQRIRRALFWSF